MGEDADPVAVADTERGESARHTLGRRHRIGVAEALVALHPMERASIRRPVRAITEKIESSQGCPRVVAKDRAPSTHFGMYRA